MILPKTQVATRKVYEDPQVVKGYIKRNVIHPALSKTVERFAQTITGTKVIDIGCGPGHYSKEIFDQGFTVIGVDYSKEMVSAARKLFDGPQFIQLDMRVLAERFEKDFFDAAFASAALLHIPKNEIGIVLSQIHSIVKSDGPVFISLKRGKGEKMVKEDKYGKDMEREFIYWEKEEFSEKLTENGFTVEQIEESVKGETEWLNFYTRVVK